MNFHIAGVGTAVPRELITQDDAARLAIELNGLGVCHANAVRTLYRRTGVLKRHSTSITSSTNGRTASQSFFPVATDRNDHGPTSALELPAQAAQSASVDSQTSADEVAHLVTVSCTGFSQVSTSA